MISKIKDTSAQLIQQYQKGDLIKNEADKPVGAAATVTERVDLSTRAKDIRQIKQILDQIPDVREDKVQELKRQIDNGSYRVHADKVAEKMVGESLIDIIV
jgi:negative regulator of flagellin synthesis FlgM